MGAYTVEETKAYIEELVKKGKAAQEIFERDYTTQRPVDEVVQAISKAVANNFAELALGAVGETGMGDVKGKMAKMGGIIAQWNYMRGKKSVGYLDNLESEPGVRIIAKPLGVIGCVMPSTNPVITVIGNAQIALKCRNAVIIAPHPSSASASMKTTEYMRKALKNIGAPTDLVQCISPEYASIEATQHLLSCCDSNIATGGTGMVKAVYSSGRPSFGVGPGNCQAIIDDEYDDMEGACKAIVENRSFDLGVPCTGEQTVHVSAAREQEFLDAMRAAGSFIIENKEDIDKFRELVFPGGSTFMNRQIVGRTVQQVGEMIGIKVPDDRIGLCFKVEGKGKEEVLNKEILCSVTRYRTYDTFKDGVAAAKANLLEWEGAGHSSTLWVNDRPDRIEYAAMILPVGRFHLNQPSRGNNNGMPPTVTVACGSWGNNSICENLQYYHLMNKTHVTVSMPNKRVPKIEDLDEFGPCPFFEDKE